MFWKWFVEFDGWNVGWNNDNLPKFAVWSLSILKCAIKTGMIFIWWQMVIRFMCVWVCFVLLKIDCAKKNSRSHKMWIDLEVRLKQSGQWTLLLHRVHKNSTITKIAWLNVSFAFHFMFVFGLEDFVCTTGIHVYCPAFSDCVFVLLRLKCPMMHTWVWCTSEFSIYELGLIRFHSFALSHDRIFYRQSIIIFRLFSI